LIFDSVITTIEHFIKDIDDPTTAKMAFSVLSKMANAWGGSETAKDGATAIPGFNQFMFTRFSPLSWALPTSAGFNSKDGQARQVLQEAGGLQQTIFLKAGTEYIDYLRSQELPGMGMTPDLIGEYLNALTQSDNKGFRSFFLVSRPLLTFEEFADVYIQSFIQRLSS
jgi:exportin-T